MAVARAAPVRKPLFSLRGDLAEKIDKYGGVLPDGVKITNHEKYGEGLRFGAGVKGGVELPKTGDVHPGGSITIVAWIKVRKESNDRFVYMHEGGAKGTIYIMVTRDGYSDSGQNIKPGCLLFGGTGVIPTEIRSSYSDGKKRIDDGEWHQIVAMHDEKEGLLRLYIDGVKSNPKRCKGTFPTLNGPIIVGKDDFNGEIAGLRVYDWPMHTKDVEALYEAERPK